MRHTGETSEFPARRSGEDDPSVAPGPSGPSESEEWIWMVDEDPAFYLSETPVA